jgi:hypothetical protein
MAQTDTNEGPWDADLLPEWTPESVRNAVRKIQEMDLTTYRPILRRLALDPRMKIVWRELLKRNEAGAFVYPGQPQNLLELPAGDDRQSAALSELFVFVLAVARAGPGCLNRISASISGASAGVRLPGGLAAG